MYYESELYRLLCRIVTAEPAKGLSLRSEPISGIHRDDLEIQLGNQLISKHCFTGPAKKPALCIETGGNGNIIKKEKGFAPLLLLDDVFEKLDEDRIGNLLQKVVRGERRPGIYNGYE